MPTSSPSSSRPTEAELRTQLENLLARAGARDRANLEKHLAYCDEQPDAAHGQLWRRLLCKLWSLAPMPVTSVGAHAVQFFIADGKEGKYRKQVFALEDRRDGHVLIYLPDVLDRAAKEPKRGALATAGLNVQRMDASNTSDPQPHFKHMIGWNRKAVRITLDAGKATGPEIDAAEALCALAADEWQRATA